MAKKPVQRSSMTQTIGGKVTREAKKDNADRGKFFWWKQTDDDVRLGNEIASTIKFLADHQSGRIDQLTLGTRLYGNSNGYNQLGMAFARPGAAATSPASGRISFNLIASVIDTLTAQIAKNEVVPTFITSGGVWGMQRKAENLSKFIEGMFYEHKAHEKITYQFRDSGAWGDGILHVFRNDRDRADVERVLPHELLVDLIESITGQTRQLHRVKIADRGVVAELFPEREEQIMLAPPANYRDLGTDGTAADLILVSQSWHLRSGEKAKDGLCVICLPDVEGNKVLEKYEWNKDYFPFVKLPYSKRLLGWWGQGAAERLQTLQAEINRNMITIQKAIWMGAGYKILSHISDKVPTQHFTNEVTSIIKWSGNIKPEYISPQFVQPDVYRWIDSLIQKGYQQEGVNLLSAAGEKPMGLNSGKAIRSYNNIAEDRQLFVNQRVEEAALELARQMIEVVKDVFEEKKQYKVTYPNTNFVEQIDWKDINLKMDEYWLKAFPTSELPEEPAAKLATVQEYMQAGMISPRAGRRLLTMPDVEMSDKLANAAEDLICKSIEEILYDKKNIRPDAEWDLALAKQLGLQYMNYAKLNNCPEENLQLLRDFLTYIDDLLGLTAPPAPPMAPGSGAPGYGGAAPLAVPAAPPVSDLLPNVPEAA